MKACFGRPFSFRFTETFLGFRIWSDSSFAGGLRYILRHPELKSQDCSLSDHSGKLVWKIRLPEEAGGQTVALKYCSGKKPLRYLVRPSLPVRELKNYQFLYRQRIPAPKVLAIGEDRTLGILRSSFIITEFVENSRDGTCFMPGGDERDNLELRTEFLQLAMPMLARLHRSCFFHKAFHLRNLLWRKAGQGGLEVFFIDVARCRIYPEALMPSAVVFDLRTMLSDLDLSEADGIGIVDLYLEHNPECGMSRRQLIEKLRNFRRRWYGESVNVLGT